MLFDLRSVSGILLVIAAVGCGPSHPPVLPITGLVTLDDQPLEQGSLIFEAPGQRPATGKIKAGAIVEMTTFDHNDGVPLGEHKVAIFVVKEDYAYVTPENPGVSSGSSNMQVTSLIPQRYNDPTTSGFTASVTSEGENHFEFALNSKK
ncbi:hypothetical protein M4951_25340 [Blastopirellula sp. J2-11]|uniref:hypothetical protein n=1 Tax=Blastopirellula sp. J2-11 TaxID=2943192 RepID=UPI0021CA5AA8|nr:hypothetical protein [Blastopirellula sp. J2-11]UUO06655.1 hypothetical protein M4951_25340 [Blastopirellula sp. J2-11]